MHQSFYTSIGLLPQIDESTGQPIKSDNKITLTLTLASLIIAAGIAVLHIGGQTEIMPFIGIDFAKGIPGLKATIDTFLDYTIYSLDPQLKGLIFVLAWTLVKVFCFDIGGIILALSSGVLFDNVLLGGIYSSFAATIGSSVAYYMAKLDTPIRKQILVLVKQYPSLWKGVAKVIANDGVSYLDITSSSHHPNSNWCL